MSYASKSVLLVCFSHWVFVNRWGWWTRAAWCTRVARYGLASFLRCLRRAKPLKLRPNRVWDRAVPDRFEGSICVAARVKSIRPLSEPATRGAHSIRTRLNSTGTRLNSIGTRLNSIGTTLNSTGARVTSIRPLSEPATRGVHSIRTRLNSIGTRLNSISARPNSIGTRPNSICPLCQQSISICPRGQPIRPLRFPLERKCDLVALSAGVCFLFAQSASVAARTICSAIYELALRLHKHTGPLYRDTEAQSLNLYVY